IKTDQIKELHSKLKTTSQIHNKKLYIINECEKMNESAGNKLLKLLEEPGNNIYAILISGNLDNVMKTIRSRCQILNFFNINAFENDFLTFEEEDKKTIVEFILKLEKERNHVIAYYTDFLRNYKEREKLRELFNFMLLAYRDVLNIKIGKKLEYFPANDEFIEISNFLTEEEIIKRLILINNTFTLINENLNVNLLFDRFIIELMGE
ncbi:hypothetical protein EOM09_03645, partial [bacterium]|nr:hypothetical protein [bacterium]